jgi:gamma-glutamyl:cysteine ligase YbdK (ATP-grasp superfamily)
MSEEAELKKKFEKETKWRLENPVKAIQEVLDGEIHATRSTYFEERVKWLEQQLEEAKEQNKGFSVRYKDYEKLMKENEALEKQVEELSKLAHTIIFTSDQPDEWKKARRKQINELLKEKE